MTCPACAKAAREPCHDVEMDCLGCAARAVARSHQRYEAQRTDRSDPDYHAKRNRYRALLEQFGVAHDRVQEAWRTDALRAFDSANLTGTERCKA